MTRAQRYALDIVLGLTGYTEKQYRELRRKMGVRRFAGRDVIEVIQANRARRRERLARRAELDRIAA